MLFLHLFPRWGLWVVQNSKFKINVCKSWESMNVCIALTECVSEVKPSEWFSIFPVENEDLLYGRWEDDIIWDAQVSLILFN